MTQTMTIEKKRMCLHLRAMSLEICGVMEEEFVVLDMEDQLQEKKRSYNSLLKR